MKNPFKEYGLFGWNYKHIITHPWVVVEESYYRVKWFIQRGYRGWADCDVWSLDYYLSGWLPDALERLAISKKGCPIGMTPKGWQTRLKRMKRGFEEARKMDDMTYVTVADCKKAMRQIDKDLALFAKYFLNLWD